MGLGATYALSTFLVGVLLLLGWFYLTVNNPSSGAMFRKSLPLFVLPILLAPAELLRFSLGMWALVALEEGVKVFGSTREANQQNKFWLTSLFGIWELTIDKPFWGIEISQSGEQWTAWALAGFLYATALPVLMHTVTAAFYALEWERRLWLAFIASWTVHMIFNESVDFFPTTLTADVVKTVILATILGWVLHRKWQISSE